MTFWFSRGSSVGKTTRTIVDSIFFVGDIMKDQGPLLEHLTRRLAECPDDFLAEPKIGQDGKVHVDAVVSDLLMDLGGKPLGDKAARPFVSAAKKQRNYLRLVLICSWLFHDEWFRRAAGYADAVRTHLRAGLGELSGLVAADLFVTDADRREELVRLCLKALGLIPGGENEIQAADRLNTLSSVERNRVVQATREHEKRVRELREAMKQKRAYEAAAKINPRVIRPDRNRSRSNPPWKAMKDGLL